MLANLATHADQTNKRLVPSLPGECLKLPDISAVQLDDKGLNTFRELSKLCRDFRQGTTQVRRIQRGSPGAGALGTTVTNFRSKFNSVAAECQQVFTNFSIFPGMKILENRLSELKNQLAEPFNDGGNDPGYSERVSVLEKLNYVNGMLHGAVQVIIEHHEHWKRTLDGRLMQQPVARRLKFEDTLSTSTATSDPSVQSQAANQSLSIANATAASSPICQPLLQTGDRLRLPGNMASAGNTLSQARAGGQSLFAQLQPPMVSSASLGGPQFGFGFSGVQVGQQPPKGRLGQQPQLGGGLQLGQQPPLGGSLQLGQLPPLGGWHRGTACARRMDNAGVRQQPESASINIQAPTIPERQGVFYIPRQPGCVSNQTGRSSESADTLEEPVSQGIISKLKKLIIGGTSLY